MSFTVDRTCVFCGSDKKLSNEHVIPQWLGRLLPFRGIRQMSIPDTFIPEHRGDFKNAATMQVGRICEDCNSGWMSALEVAAKPIIGEMVIGRGVLLTEDAQAIAAAWALKTSLTWMLSRSDVWQRYPDLYPQFYRDRKPTENHHISIAAYSGEPQRPHLFHHCPFQLTYKDVGAGTGDIVKCHLITFFIGHLVTQTVYGPDIDVTNERGFQSIWPMTGEFIWPRGIVSAVEVERFAKLDLPYVDGIAHTLPSWDDLVPWVQDGE
jgi:hypothetical protein